MTLCYNCGEEIEIRNDGFRKIPFHPSGSCSGRGAGSTSSYSSLRTTRDGEVFEFPFTVYPSYVNPNARCPVCEVAVYFYQSPYGGRVFFDELGPPWPKHPCTDNPIVRQHFSTAQGRARILNTAQAPQTVAQTPELQTPAAATPQPSEHPGPVPAWAADGWMPFVVKAIVSRPIGIEATGDLFPSGLAEAVPFLIVQTSSDARFYKVSGSLHIGYSLVQNSSQILSVLNECPILLKQNPDMEHLLLSSFLLTRAGEVEEINLSVNGRQMEAPPGQSNKSHE